MDPRPNLQEEGTARTRVQYVEHAEKSIIAGGDVNAERIEMGGNMQADRIRAKQIVLNVAGMSADEIQQLMANEERDVPPLAQWLVDRARLMNELENAIDRLAQTRSDRPLMGIFHGNDRQSHDMLRLRIAEHELPVLLGNEDDKLTLISVAWDRTLDESSDFEGQMTRAVAIALEKIAGEDEFGRGGPRGISRRSSLEEIQAAVRQIPGDVLIYFVPTVNRWFDGKSGPGMNQRLEALAAYFASWTSRPSEGRIIVLASLKYEEATPKKSLFSFLGKDAGFSAARVASELARLDLSSYPGVHFMLVDALENITREDVENWSQLEANVTWTLPSDEAIREMFDAYRKATGEDSMPMAEAGKQLERLILQVPTSTA